MCTIDNIILLIKIIRLFPVKHVRSACIVVSVVVYFGYLLTSAKPGLVMTFHVLLETCMLCVLQWTLHSVRILSFRLPVTPSSTRAVMVEIKTFPSWLIALALACVGG